MRAVLVLAVEAAEQLVVVVVVVVVGDTGSGAHSCSRATLATSLTLFNFA